MKRTRNKYDFKWWHGVLGLLGLSMVITAVRGRSAAALEPDPDRSNYPYRGTTIVVEPSRNQPGYVVEVFAISGERLQWSVRGTVLSAQQWAEAWVDRYIDDLGGSP